MRKATWVARAAGVAAVREADGTWVRLDDIGGALAVYTRDGAPVAATASARTLLSRLREAPAPDEAPGARTTALPDALWRALATAPLGQPVEWRPPGSTMCVGCTRYQLGEAHMLVLMREISDRARALARRLHEQRLEATGRLVATIAHDLRAPLASIVFNADVLAGQWDGLSAESARQSLEEVRDAANRLRRAIDGLLDFARVGPPIAQDVAIAEILERVAGLLRPLLREHDATLTIGVHPGAAWTRGNPLVIEQVFVNLVMNAVEATAGPVRVAIGTAPDGDGSVRAWVHDDGPGVPAELHSLVFEPFFTTKPKGTGLGLTLAREALGELGGQLRIEPSPTGARFALRLPASRTAADKGEAR